MEMIGLSDDKSDPTTGKIVYFADCRDGSNSFVRYYISEEEVKRKTTPASDKNLAARKTPKEMEFECIKEISSKLRFPSSMKAIAGGTSSGSSPVKPGNVTVTVYFSAENEMKVRTPHRGICFYQGGVLTEASIDLQ